MTRSARTGILFAFMCLAILGALPILSNARPSGSSGLTFSIWLTVWQLVASLPLLLAETRKKSAGTAPSWKIGTIVTALFTGALFGLSTYMYVVAAEKAGAVNMVIALQAYPLFAMIIEAIALGKRKSAPEVGFTLLMIAALFYLTTGGTMRISGVSWWSLYALGIPLIWSVAHILLRRVLVETPVTPNQVTVSRLIISGVFLLILALATGEAGSLVAAASDLDLQKAAIVMGVAYYAELILWFHAVRHIDVSLASSITVPAPAVTMLITVLLLGGTVAPYQIVAMGVIVLAMYGLLLAGKRAERVASQAG